MRYIWLMEYNWQQNDWPQFSYDLREVEPDLAAFTEKAGVVSGLLRGLSEDTQAEAIVDLMISEAIKTSEIEGEYLSRKDVMSSIRNNLGLNTSPEIVSDLASKGAAELMIAVRNSWDDLLTDQELFRWHRALFQGSRNISLGCWRAHAEPMQVVSGRIGAEAVHYEAPPSSQVEDEMDAFFQWFNTSRQQFIYAPVRSAIAHLYFESIHPFEDGNGRIGRVISEKALSQGLGRPALLSLSQSIEANKKAYYDALEAAQKSNEITSWVHYFVGMVLEAQTAAEAQIEFILKKTRFFDQWKNQLNERQLKVIRRMLEEGPEEFKEGMNARKYISMTKVSKATATRDLQHLAELGIFIPEGGGRSIRYRLKI